MKHVMVAMLLLFGLTSPTKAVSSYFQVEGSLADGAYSFNVVLKMVDLPLPPAVLASMFAPVQSITGTFSNGVQSWGVTGLRTSSVLLPEESWASSGLNTFRSGASPHFPELRFAIQDGYAVNFRLISGAVIVDEPAVYSARTDAPDRLGLLNTESISMQITSVVQVPAPIPAVPEPSTMLMWGLGIMSMLTILKKRNKAS